MSVIIKVVLYGVKAAIVINGTCDGGQIGDGVAIDGQRQSLNPLGINWAE